MGAREIEHDCVDCDAWKVRREAPQLEPRPSEERAPTIEIMHAILTTAGLENQLAVDLSKLWPGLHFVDSVDQTPLDNHPV
jgi:hypothetical protein